MDKIEEKVAERKTKKNALNKHLLTVRVTA